jgi:hypothetical protein
MRQNYLQGYSPAAASSSGKALLFWKILQALLWFTGIALLLIMFLAPSLGVTLFWNILIPVAPALLVIGTGVWRNICPLSTTSLLPDRFGISKKLKPSQATQAVFHFAGVMLLLLIIPLRHVVFNTNGQFTALIILLLAIPALTMGFIYERKSGWCSGLCPIHPVEKLYGSGVAFSLPNAHCNECVKCSVPCPDSTTVKRPFLSHNSGVTNMTELLLVGGFPGYVWGWFHVPDYTGDQGWQHLEVVYGYPLLGAAVTILLYVFASWVFQKQNKNVIISLFAATAVSCYYWFRLPMLFGFGNLDSNGMLIDLSGSIPQWSMTILTPATTVFFFWWMIIRRKTKISWSVRPQYTKEILAGKSLEL